MWRRVLALLMAGGGLVEVLPSTALAAIVIAAAIKLFEAPQVFWLYSVRRSEFALCIVATGGVVLLGVLNGLAIVIGLSLANFIRRGWRPYGWSHFHSTFGASVKSYIRSHQVEWAN